jgi:hypothetical protein
MAKELQDPCRSSAPNARLSRCAAEWRFWRFEMGYATKNAFRLREGVNNREMPDAAVGRGASYCDCELLVIFTRRLLGIRAVHLKGFGKRAS